MSSLTAEVGCRTTTSDKACPFSSLHSLATVPDVVIIEDRREEQEKDYDHGKTVGGDIERCYQRRARVVDDRPVKRDWEQAETRIHLQPESSAQASCMPGGILTPKIVLIFWFFGQIQVMKANDDRQVHR